MWRRHIVELTERIAALRLARDASEAELLGWLEEHAEEVHAALVVPLEQARSRLAKAVAAEHEATGRLLALGGLAHWTGDPFRRPPPRPQ